MLKILEKLANGEAEFSSAELRSMARYFSMFARQQRIDMLEKIWPQVSPDMREGVLVDAIGDLYYEDKIKDVGAFRFLFKKAEEHGTPTLWEKLFSEQYDSDVLSTAV